MEKMILYEDQELLVVNKPSGLAVQCAGTRKKDLESMVKTWIYEQSGQANPYLGVVHRLDQPVQGIVVFARTPQTAAALSRQLQEGGMKKVYLAVACGTPKQESGRLEHYLKKDGRTNLSQVVDASCRGAKKAVLEYRVREQREGLSLLEIHLLTGRHHQIRVQTAAAGMPLYGDQKYNPKAQNGQQIALCASRLELKHPKMGKPMCFTCKPDGEAFALFGRSR